MMRMVRASRRPNGSPSVSSQKAGASGSHCRRKADTDFADLLATEGAAAVRTVLSAATEFLPASPVLERVDHRHACAMLAIDDTKKLYPLPRLENLSSSIARASEGSVRLYKHAGKDKRGQDRWEMVATPFGSGGAPALHGSRRGVRLARPCRGDGRARARRRLRPRLASRGSARARSRARCSPPACAPKAMATASRFRSSKPPIPTTRSSWCRDRAGIASRARTIRCS